MIRRCRKKWLTFYIVGQVRLFKISLSNVEINQVYDYDAMEKVNHFMKNFNIQSMVLFSNSTFSSKGWGACVMG